MHQQIQFAFCKGVLDSDLQQKEAIMEAVFEVVRGDICLINKEFVGIAGGLHNHGNGKGPIPVEKWVTVYFLDAGERGGYRNIKTAHVWLNPNKTMRTYTVDYSDLNYAMDDVVKEKFEKYDWQPRFI